MIPTVSLSFSAVRNTTTFRLASAFAILFIVALTAALGLVYVQTARELTTRSDLILQLEARRLQSTPAADLPGLIASEADSPGHGINYAALFGGSGERISGNLIMPPKLQFGRPTDSRVPDQDRTVRLLAVRTLFGETVLVGRDISQIRALRLTILNILFWSGVITAAAGLLIGLILSIPLLARVRRLQATSHRIMRGDLGARMPLAGRGDELDRFASTVNAMIDEVVRALGQARSVTDAVAHDLRTPLTHVRTLLSRAQQSSAIDSAFRDVATQAIHELDLVFERFSALIRVAEVESGGRRGFAPTALLPLLASALELYRPLAEDRDQSLELIALGDATVKADGTLLFEAVANLLDNAIKFTPPGGRITVTLSDQPNGPMIEVRDNGLGVEPAERDAVLQRFYRGTAGANAAGSGLGLSLVAAIVHLHRYSLTLLDAAPGLVVRLGCFDDEVTPRR